MIFRFRKAQAEHDAFAELLRSKDIEVVYLEDLAAEALINEEVRRQFIDQFLEEANIRDESAKEKVRELMLEIDDNEELIQKAIARHSKTKLPKYEQNFNRYG